MDLPTSKAFLITEYLIVAVTNLNCGFLLTNFASTQNIVSLQLGWATKNSETRDETMINDVSILGLMLGCLLAKNFLFLGRKRVVLLANLIAIVSVCLCAILNLWAIFFGKFLLGFSSGLNIVACSIYNAETLPAKTMSYMGTNLNIGITFGLLLSTFTQNLSVENLTDSE